MWDMGLLSSDNRVVNMTLANRLGINEALFIERLHFWLDHERRYGVEVSGERFIRNTFPQWHEQFPHMSLRTLKTVVKHLEDERILITCKVGDGYDRTKGYRLDYEHEALQAPDSKVQKLHDGSGKTCTTKSAEPALSSYTDKTSEGTGSTSVDDVLPPSGFDREKELDLVRSNPTHGPTLARFWRRCMSEYGHTNATQPGMKVKDQKMLKEMMKLLPEGGERMLLNAIEHYALFVNFAREGYNVNLAARPQVQKLMLVVDGIAEFQAPMIDDDTDYSNLGLKGLLDDDDSNADNS